MDEDKEVKVNDTAITVSNSGIEKQHGAQHSVAPYQLNYMNEAEIASLEVFIKRVMRSDKCGIKSVEDGLAIAMRAKDLRLPFSTCIEHIHVVQGKTGIDVHIIKALLVKGSVSWEKVDNYRALYEYTDGFNAYDEDKLPSDCIKCLTPKEAQTKNAEDKDHEHIYVYPVKYYKDYNGNIYKEYQLNGKFEIATNTAEAKQINTQIEEAEDNRILIPITDPEAHVRYYAIYPKDKKNLFQPIIKQIKDIDWKKTKELSK